MRAFLRTRKRGAESCKVAVVGLDEVGRGALAGPVMVGACALVFSAGADGSVMPPELPSGIRDSKLVSAKKRERLFDVLSSPEWTGAVGNASAAEIDDAGIVTALGRAAARAWDIVVPRLEADGVLVVAGILDGNMDYLGPALKPDARDIPIDVRVKGDQNCMSVAAASILAKVTRDRHMVALAEHAPEYGWASNKGYGSAVHRQALRERGLHPEHRASWNLVPHQPSFDEEL